MAPLALVVAAVAMFAVGGSLAPGPLIDTPVPMDNPFGLVGIAGNVAVVLVVSGLALYTASLLACMVLRFRSSRGMERQ